MFQFSIRSLALVVVGVAFAVVQVPRPLAVPFYIAAMLLSWAITGSSLGFDVRRNGRGVALGALAGLSLAFFYLAWRLS